MKTVIRALIMLTATMYGTVTLAADSLDLWFSPGWKTKAGKAKAITKALSKKSGIQINPRIANNYPQILSTFDSGEPALVFVGSFVQAIIRARGLGEGLVQAVTGKEFYSGVLVYPKGQNPKNILRNHPTEIAFTRGASSGESSAKAATAGKASFPTKNHGATCGAVKSGLAKAGVIKNWWWAANKKRFPDLKTYNIPKVSLRKNPDNVLAASKGVSAAVKAKIAKAAMTSRKAFGAKKMVKFNPATLDFSLALMSKGKIDPKTYSW